MKKNYPGIYMMHKLILQLECDNPQLFYKSLYQDNIDSIDCKIHFELQEKNLIVNFISDSIINLQKTFNSFTQRYKLAEDTYKFCLKN